ncbi:MAG: Crp/Fnr family transcriptional regulator [Flavobacteriales bacterium]
MNTTNIWYFDNGNLFGMLCPHKFKAYKNQHTFNKYKKQEYIYFEKDQANKVYLIEKGKVKIGFYTESGDEIIKAILTRGELFGEKAILGEEKRNEFAKSVDNNTSICPIDVDTMHELMRDNKTFSFKIYKLIGFRIKRLERHLKILLFKDTKTRLLEFINELSANYNDGKINNYPITINHPYTQKEMACLIGSSRPTLNILFNELKEEKIIDFNQKKIILLKKIKPC